jgi:hypothetical protein
MTPDNIPGPGERSAPRSRPVLALVTTLAAVALVVLAYRVTAPGARSTPATGGKGAADVLRVGALPVT